MRQKQSLQEAKYLAATAAFAVALSLFSLKGILTVPDGLLVASTGERGPASLVAGASPESAGAAGELETLTWDCRQKSEIPVVKSTHVRLKSKYCDRTTNPDVRIKNLANGYTASVFAAAKGFSTDFIDLREGLNEISIEWKNAKGESVSHAFTIRREPAAAATGVQR